MNVLKIRDFSLRAIGRLGSQNDDCDEIVVMDKTARYYKKCWVQGGRLVGAVLVGDGNEFAAFRDLIEKETELDDLRWTLLRGSNSVSEPPKGRIICSCCNVGVGNVEEAIEAGCGDLQAIADRTCAGTGCGACRNEISGLINKKTVDTMEAVTP